MKRIRLVHVIALFSLSSSLSFASDTYVITPIDAPASVGQNFYTSANGINNLGQIVGEFRDGSVFHGYILDNGEFTLLDVPFPGVYETLPLAINNKGEVVGIYRSKLPITSTEVHGFHYHDGGFEELLVPGALETGPTGINDRGDIVGIYAEGTLSDFRVHAFIYSEGFFTTLDAPFQGTKATRAFGINNRNQIVGAYYSDPNAKAFIYENGEFKTLWERPQSDLATGVNNLGEIVGITFGRPYNYLYRKGIFTLLDLPGYYVEVTDINDLGEIVGFYTDNYGFHGFLAEPVRRRN